MSTEYHSSRAARPEHIDGPGVGSGPGHRLGPPSPPGTDPQFPRRSFLHWTACGIGGAGLLSLLSQDRLLEAAPVPGEANDPPPHFAPRVRRVIHVVACGGFSQVDTFDYKPELQKLHGKPLSSDERPDVFFGRIGLLRKNDWAFRQRGESGLWVSDLFPHLAGVADELTVIKSMFAETSNHTPATFQENSGFRLNGFPVLGAWLSYGLGSETDNLPTFVVIPDPRGLPAGGSINWTNGFLPARHQGVMIRSRGTPIDDLFPARAIPADTERHSRALLQMLNRRHEQARGGDDVLAARIRSYELAARMQLAVPEATDLDGETAETHRLYGLGGKQTDDFGRACLLARRLLERGVRFVQLFSGGAFGSPRINWDGHEDMRRNHGREFGRTPFTQSADGVLGTGRDHNQNGFSVWLAGAGLKGGTAYGTTDVFGWKAEENRTSWYDFHGTVLHLLGIDHERLTFYHNGIRRRLTNVHGHVIEGILA